MTTILGMALLMVFHFQLLSSLGVFFFCFAYLTAVPSR